MMVSDVLKIGAFASPLQYPGDPWYVIGHSMGAAMATLSALDLKFSIQPTPDVRVYTFGSPRVGNDIFATFFESTIQVLLLQGTTVHSTPGRRILAHCAAPGHPSFGCAAAAATTAAFGCSPNVSAVV